MKRSSRLAVLALVLACTPAVRADEVTVIAPGGIRTAVERLIPAFEKKTGHKVIATFGSGLATKAQVIKGDPFDVSIVQQPYPEVLASGHVVASSETPLVSVAVGIAVRQGQRKPDISSAEAVKRLLLAAKSIAYPNPAEGAAAGVSFDLTLNQLGIVDQMQSKLVRAQGGAGTMAAVAKGDVELAVTFVSEMQTTPGVEVVGPLPSDISPPTSMSGFVSVRAKSPEAARAFVQFLASPDAATVYRSLGMQPRR